MSEWHKLSDRKRVKTLLAMGFIPTWLEELLDEGDKLLSELEFIWDEYGKAKNERLTKDALWLKIAVLEQKLLTVGGEV